MTSEETKLKIVAEEIKEILRKYDVAGAIALHTPGYGEYFMHLNPSYSCAYMYEDNEVRFYSKKENHNSVKEQLTKQGHTSNMLSILKDLSAFNFGNLNHLSVSFDKLIDATHTKGTLKINKNGRN